jgi:protein involved in polysaccharide export with SLBB domain
MHRYMLMVATVLVWAMPAAAQTPAASPAPLPSPAASEAVSMYPGDFIRVAIWREEDLSGEFPVETDGSVTLPLIGRLQVSGRPFSVVRDSLLTAYREQLRNPSIVLTPLRRVNILGEVQQPGLYLVDPTISLAGAIAMAGGANQRGNLDRIRIVRQGEVVVERVQPSQTLGSADVRSNDQIFVSRRAWISENLPTLLLGIPSLVLSILAIAERL